MESAYPVLLVAKTRIPALQCPVSVGVSNLACSLHATSTSTSATSSTAATSTRAATASAATASAIGLLASLVLGLRRVVHEQGVQGKGIRQDDVADCGTADGHGVDGDSRAGARRHLDGAHGHVHEGVDGRDRAMHEGAVLELDGDSLVLALHEEAVNISVLAAASVGAQTYRTSFMATGGFAWV